MEERESRNRKSSASERVSGRPSRSNSQAMKSSGSSRATSPGRASSRKSTRGPAPSTSSPEEPGISSSAPGGTCGSRKPSAKCKRNKPPPDRDDEYRPDKYGADEYGPDEYRPDKYGPDEYGPGEYGPDEYGPDQTSEEFPGKVDPRIIQVLMREKRMKDMGLSPKDGFLAPDLARNAAAAYEAGKEWEKEQLEDEKEAQIDDDEQSAIENRKRRGDHNPCGECL